MNNPTQRVSMLPLLYVSIAVLLTTGGLSLPHRGSAELAGSAAPQGPVVAKGMSPEALVAIGAMENDPSDFLNRYSPETVSRDLYSDGRDIDGEQREAVVRYAVRAGENYVISIRADAFNAQAALSVTSADESGGAQGNPLAVRGLASRAQDFVLQANSDGWVSVVVRGKPGIGAIAGTFRAILFKLPQE